MRPFLLGMALSIALTTAGCCADPWRSFPESTPPDRSCSTGSTHGDDVYIWECLRGQHVVVTQASSEMMCASPKRAVAPCGSVTEIEKQLALTPEQCAGPRNGREWR